MAPIPSSKSSASPGVGAGPGTPATTPSTTPTSGLTNQRFAADPLLQSVAAGEATLPANARGQQGQQSITLVQTALADLRFAPPNFGVDGDWGAKTKAALSAFQKNAGIAPTGTLDAKTLAALDRAAPPPGTRARVYPEYEKMFQDRVLNVTLGIGFDDDSTWDDYAPWQIKTRLGEMGFRPLNAASLNDLQLRTLGLDPAKIDRTATYYLKSFDHDGKPVRALVKYIDRFDPQAKRHFAEGFASNDLVLYAGHARYGSGPDFDEKHSNAGNFVLGANGEGHKRGTLTPAYDAGMREILKGAGNDLERTAMTPEYQLMLFSGCKTRDYLDELRGIPANKNTSNLDLVLSNDVVMWDHMSANMLGLLDGVMQGKSMDELNDALYVENEKKVTFLWDGFGDNPRR